MALIFLVFPSLCAVCTCDLLLSAGTMRRKHVRAYLPRDNNLPHGRHRRGPRAHVRDRTADTTAAALPAVETTPTGAESAGGPSRTAAVAGTPPPSSVDFFGGRVKFMMPVPDYIQGDYFPKLNENEFFPTIVLGYFFLTVEAASELTRRISQPSSSNFRNFAPSKSTVEPGTNST